MTTIKQKSRWISGASPILKPGRTRRLRWVLHIVRRHREKDSRLRQRCQGEGRALFVGRHGNAGARPGHWPTHHPHPLTHLSAQSQGYFTLSLTFFPYLCRHWLLILCYFRLMINLVPSTRLCLFYRLVHVAMTEQRTRLSMNITCYSKRTLWNVAKLVRII